MTDSGYFRNCAQFAANQACPGIPKGEFLFPNLLPGIPFSRNKNHDVTSGPPIPCAPLGTDYPRKSLPQLAQPCAAMHSHAQPCTAMHSHAQPCAAMHSHAQPCTAIHKSSTHLRTAMHKSSTHPLPQPPQAPHTTRLLEYS
jgi:hypothetical protein